MLKKRIMIRAILPLVLVVLIGTSIAAVIHAHAAAPSHHYVPSGNGAQKKVKVYATWYGYDDNSGQTENQHGSADIAYPKSDGYPTLHDQATEGSGTYNDPVTFATPNKDLKIFPIGSIIYVPFVKKYFVMEDQCGDTDVEGCQHGTHVDLWMGPPSYSDPNALGDCEDNATPGSSVQVIVNPPSNLPVDTTTMFSNNQCTINIY